ncbi:MAG: hypothetical protein L0Z71_19545 [Anaerolineae bacterium]|nr:hypothetical protein [Anaerolineae bacterium]
MLSEVEFQKKKAELLAKM